MLTLFTSPTCPKCRVIKAKLTAANIPYSVSEDMEEMSKHNIRTLPMGLTDDGTLLSFNDLVKLTKEANA